MSLRGTEARAVRKSDLAPHLVLTGRSPLSAPLIL
jgi:hypothetical protein